MSSSRFINIHFCFNSSPFCYVVLLFCLFSSVSVGEQLPTCNVNELKYDFTECDAFGGRWRVSVPSSPDKCSAGVLNPPIRVNKCFTSCEGGQFFNMTSLLCQDCAPGHYSLGGGIIIDSFNDSSGQLPNGFRITTESTKHTPELNKKCHGWFVDPTSHHLISTHSINTRETDELTDFGIGCVSLLTYTAKVVKSGRLRFTYHYQIPSDVSSSLLFTFNYRLYGSESPVVDDDANSNIRFPIPTLRKYYETVEVTFDQPGLYVFTWRSVLIGNMKSLMSSRRNSEISFGQFGNFLDSDDGDPLGDSSAGSKHLLSGLIRIKNVQIKGVAYASECTPCDPGTFAANFAQRECEPCPINTENTGFGADKCRPCDPITEYSLRGSVKCRKRPECGISDFYSEPIGKCDPLTKQQNVQYKWIEPRICIDSARVFSNQTGTINCTSELFIDINNGTITGCDPGMELKSDGVGEFCQFCPANYYRSEQFPNCKPCPPFTSPYYALSVQQWNSSLPAWSYSFAQTNYSKMLSEDYFADNTNYLNAYFSRQCIRTDEKISDVVYREERSVTELDGTDQSVNDRCDPHVAWQPFRDHIRTGPSAMLDSYLILSITIPGFHSLSGGEISFVYETHCAPGDRCSLLFIETKNEINDLQAESSGSGGSFEAEAKKKFLHQPIVNEIIKSFSQSSNGRQSYRYRVDGNLSVTYSWLFKRTNSFQSYTKLYSLLLTNSYVGAAIECRRCPYQQSETMNECVTCPDGKYLEVTDETKRALLFNATHVLSPSSLTSDGYKCHDCPANHLLNRSRSGLPIGPESCVSCGPNLITNERKDVCFSNCTLMFGDDYYDLRELPQPIQYRAGNLFTAGGTQYLHLFRISLCGHPKQSTSMAVCMNNITAFANDDQANSSGVRSYVCRSTLIPDGSHLFATQSVSLGDDLIGVSREPTFQNISVHKDFLSKDPSSSSHQVPSSSSSSPDYHLYYSTKAATAACPTGRRMTITMRCTPETDKTHPDQAVVSTPKSCPDGTCDGCNFHLLIETGTAAACRVCRPFSSDYSTLAGECINGQQDVHFFNPKGCVVKKVHDGLSGGQTDVIKRSCTILLPRQIQIGIAIAVAFGLVLLMLVFYFWNQNRSLEYKYTKLIENAGDGKDGDDDGVNLDNCCAEDAEDDEINSSDQQQTSSTHRIMFSEDFDRHRDVPKESRNKQPYNSRIDKAKKSSFGSSKEMQQLFGDSGKTSDPSTSLIGNGKRVDHEGYETIHLTSAAAAGNSQIA